MRLSALVLVLALAACRDTTAPTAPSIDGHWTGSTAVTSPQLGTQLVVSIAQDGTTLSGAGFLLIGASTYVGIPNITGSFTGVLPVRFVLESANGPVTFTSPTYSRDSLPGTLTGSGFAGERLTLRRQ